MTDFSNTLWVKTFMSCCSSSTPFLLSNWAINCHCAILLCCNKALLLFRVSATGNLHGHVHGWVWDNNEVTRILFPLPVALPRCTAPCPGRDRRCSRTQQAAITEWQTKVSAIFEQEKSLLHTTTCCCLNDRTAIVAGCHIRRPLFWNQWECSWEELSAFLIGLWKTQSSRVTTFQRLASSRAWFKLKHEPLFSFCQWKSKIYVKTKICRMLQDTMVICNFNGTLMDKDIWGDPEVFRPERFIDAQGSIFIPDQYTPFGFGMLLTSHGGNYLTCVSNCKEECCIMSRYSLLLCDAVLFGRWVLILQRTLLPPYCHFSTLKMEATGLPKHWYPSTSLHRGTSQKTSNLVRISHFIHFNTWKIRFMSTGKHRCMGETLAKSNVFLFTASLLQNFNFSVPPGSLPPTTDAIDGVTPSPKPFQALVTPRAVGWTVFIQGGCAPLQGNHYETEEQQTISSFGPLWSDIM